MTWKPEETLEEQVAGAGDRLREALGVPPDLTISYDTRPVLRGAVRDGHWFSETPAQAAMAQRAVTAAGPLSRPPIIGRYGWLAGPEGPVNGVTGFEVTRYLDGSLRVELLGDGVVLASARYPLSDRLDSVADSVAAPSADDSSEAPK